MRLDLDTYKEILDTITRNKSRSLLTGFGVFWGVFMLIALMGGGQGLKEMLQTTSQALPPTPPSSGRRTPPNPTRDSTRGAPGRWKRKTWTDCAIRCPNSMSSPRCSSAATSRWCLETKIQRQHPGRKS